MPANYYAFHPRTLMYRGVYTSKEGEKPLSNLTTISPVFSGNEGKYFKWNGTDWDVLDEMPSIPSDVPQEISKLQGRQQMIYLGVHDQVQAAIDAIKDPTEKALVQSFWEHAPVYKRNHPQMIQLSEALGFTPEELDQAFIDAALL